MNEYEILALAAAAKKRKQTTSPQMEVVATTDDGGQVYRQQDGTLGFKSSGYSTTDQAQIERIMQGATPASQSLSGFDQQTIAQHPVAARVQEFIQGAPLVGEWADEAVGLVSPQAAGAMRATSNAMEREHPGQSAALNIGGAIATAVPLAIGAGAARAGDFVAKGANLATRGLRAGAVAAPAGAIEGAAAFSGRADSGNRAKSAGTGALVGGGLAVALGPIASIMGEGVATLAKRIKKLDIRTIADEFGVSLPAARTVKQALMNDDLAAAQARLAQLGDDAMLADAGQATGALLDASANTGGTGLRVAREAADTRATQAGQRLPAVLDNILGKPRGIKATAREIAQETSPARQAAYDLAYSKPINYADDAGRSIEGVLARVPPKTLHQAITEANEAMLEAGMRNQQIMAQIADDGSVGFSQMPDVRQLDFLKRALDDVARNNTDQFGRFTGAGNRARRLAGDLRDAMKEAVPEYGRAVRLGGDKIQRDQALELGKNLLFRGTSVEDVKLFLAQGATAESRIALRQGVRESIETTLSNVRRTITDPNVDAREAMTLVKDMSSRANIAKMRLILGSKKADQLLSELDRAASALGLRAAISMNSKTAIRQSIQGQVTDEATPGIARRTAGNIGNPLDAAKEITQQVAGIDPRSMTAREKAIFGEIAQALVGIRGDDAQRALAAVRGAMEGQPIKDEVAQLIGRVISGSAAVGFYQQGKRSLAR